MEINKIYQLKEYDEYLKSVSDKYHLTNLLEQDDKSSNKFSYWNRIGELSACGKLREEYGYSYLHEIQSISNQIHFGVLNCLVFKDLISDVYGSPNIWNHRFSFSVESSIHAIYGYWNRVALFINIYLDSPLPKHKVHFNNIIKVFLDPNPEYNDVREHEFFKYLLKINDSLNNFGRNEFTHNYSLLTHDFTSFGGGNYKSKLKEFPDELIYHNNTIANDILRLVGFFEFLEIRSQKRREIQKLIYLLKSTKRKRK